MFASIDSFVEELSRLCLQYFPTARLETVYHRSAMASLRLIITPHLFIDIYCNTRTARFDFSLIQDSVRIFGYDNLQSWHHHPFENPDTHVDCLEPTLEQMVSEIALLVDKFTRQD
jgi:hypothetical protein